MSDYIVRATAADSQIRAFAITSKEMVEGGKKSPRHKTGHHGSVGTSFEQCGNDGNNDERG